MCGGDYSGWETPKQLTPICGEPLVRRTIRLLREEGVEDIAISTNDQRFEELGLPILRHDNPWSVTDGQGAGCWASGFYPTEDPACYIMGDVVFSPEAVRKIVRTPTTDIAFFASAPPFSPMYIKRYGEPFAFKVVNQRGFRAAIEFVKRNMDTGVFSREPIAWELWNVITGADLRCVDYSRVTPINDYTCDIDKPEDAQAIERVLCGL